MYNSNYIPICPLCESTLRSPLKTTCQHIFCQKCILDYLNKNLMCPFNCCILFANELIRITNIEKYAHNLFFQCPFKKQGCKISLQLSEIDKHVQEKCLFSKKNNPSNPNQNTNNEGNLLKINKELNFLKNNLNCQGNFSKSNLKESNFSNTTELSLLKLSKETQILKNNESEKIFKAPFQESFLNDKSKDKLEIIIEEFMNMNLIVNILGDNFTKIAEIIENFLSLSLSFPQLENLKKIKKSIQQINFKKIQENLLKIYGKPEPQPFKQDFEKTEKLNLKKTLASFKRPELFSTKKLIPDSSLKQLKNACGTAEKNETKVLFKKNVNLDAQKKKLLKITNFISPPPKREKEEKNFDASSHYFLTDLSSQVNEITSSSKFHNLNVNNDSSLCKDLENLRNLSIEKINIKSDDKVRLKDLSFSRENSLKKDDLLNRTNNGHSELNTSYSMSNLNPPSSLQQKIIIKNLMTKEFRNLTSYHDCIKFLKFKKFCKAKNGKLNEAKYLINAQWWRKWLEFVDFNESGQEIWITDQSSLPKRPTYINNSDLLLPGADSTTTSTLKPGLLEHHDFEAISWEIYKNLKKWYNIDVEIKRYLKNDPLFEGQFFLDIYPEKKKGTVSNDFEKMKEKFIMSKGFNKGGILSSSSKSVAYNDIYEFNGSKKKEEKGNSCAVQ